MKIVSVIGARPQFVKAAALSVALRKQHEEILVHTGQHYDPALSNVFFSELGIPEPSRNLNVGSGSHAEQTAAMMVGIEKILEEQRPAAVLVYGDTNSTLAAALAASKLDIPIAHVEAGLRSFNRKMPEEINRVVTDRLSRWLFVPSAIAKDHLAAEGITNGVFEVGDIMLDCVLTFRERALERSHILAELKIAPGDFFLATIHRAENTDNRANLAGIIEGLGRLPSRVIVPLHPRTRKHLDLHRVAVPKNIVVIEPAGYFDMLALQERARCVITDSGGVQKEAYYVHTPCVTVRDETEWTETVTAGWNRLCRPSAGAIVEAVALQADARGREHPPLYGRGDTAERISTVLAEAR